MPSLEEILNKPSGEIRPPEAYPVGTYHCLVDGPPTPGKSSQKQTDFLQFKFRILSAMGDVNAEKVVEQQVVGKTITNDFYISDENPWRLNGFLIDSLGIDNNEGKKPLREMIAEAPG